MILSVSRRTDIPAFYSDWFFDRIEKGFILVRNPMNYRQVSRVNLSPEVVDGIVFWSKNPAPMLDRLSLLDDYSYYFQFTVTPYGKDIETGVPAKVEVLATFKKLSAAIGAERVIWRYDPILISRKYSASYHLRALERMARELNGFTRKVAFSFVTQRYREVQRNAEALGISALTEEEKLDLCCEMAKVARHYDMELEACAEKLAVEGVGIGRAQCVDGDLLARISGQAMSIPKDKNQRPGCVCAASVDIGMYNTCANGCLYCYANYSQGAISLNMAAHDKSSPMISGNAESRDKVTERKV